MNIPTKFITFIIFYVSALLSPIYLHAAQQLSIGQSENIYLKPSLPAGGWITSASWSTDVIGLECSNSGEWGTMVTAYGYWEDTATLSCMYTYSYYGADDRIHVSHGYEYYYFTCKGYPISISPGSITLDTGETATVSFSISGASIGEISPRWISSDENVATVYSSGNYSATVTAKRPGYCTITCYSYMGAPVTCSVKVNSVKPTAISLNPSEATVTVDRSIRLNCVFTPSYASASLTWKSKNPKIASVSSDGTVKGIKSGVTTITATTENGLTAQCAITVTDKYVNPRGPVSKSLDGTGTSSNPYKIKSAADLRYLADKVNSGTSFDGKHFLQTADITINSANKDSETFAQGEIWIPIGKKNNPFKGSYDGGNHSISGIFISNATEFEDLEDLKECAGFGLFGLIGDNVSICNLKMDNVIIEALYLISVGGVVGSSGNGVAITNCHISNASLSSDRFTAGIISRVADGGGTIEKCSSSADIITRFRDGYAAGICVSNGNCKTIITNCINTGSIKSASPAGIAINSGDIYNCCNSGNIRSTSNISSGIMHTHSFNRSLSVTIEHCVNYGEISSKNKYNCGAILGELWSGDVYCNNNVYDNSTKLYGINSSNKHENLVIENNNKSYSLSELKSQTVLNLLNSNLKSGWSRWVKGKDGYPTLDFYDEISGIESIVDDNTDNEVIDVYNLQGILILHNAAREEISSLTPGIYVIHQGKTTEKIIIK